MSLVVGDRSSLLLCFSCLDILVTAQKRRNRKRSRMAQLFPGRIPGEGCELVSLYSYKHYLMFIERTSRYGL